MKGLTLFAILMSANLVAWSKSAPIPMTERQIQVQPRGTGGAESPTDLHLRSDRYFTISLLEVPNGGSANFFATDGTTPYQPCLKETEHWADVVVRDYEGGAIGVEHFGCADSEDDYHYRQSSLEGLFDALASLTNWARSIHR